MKKADEYIIFITLFLLSFLLCCRNHTKQEVSKEVYKIDMYQSETIGFDSLIKNIESIQLETENVPSFEYCKRMIQYKDYIYLLTQNRGDYEVFIYENNGKFIKKIGFGNSDILFLSTLLIEPDSEQLWVISNHLILNKYELNGTFINRTILPFPGVDMTPTQSKDFLLFDGGFNKEWNYSIALTDFSSVRRTFLPIDPNTKTQFLPESMYATDINKENIFIRLPNNDTIYYYNEIREEVLPYYHLNFHGDFLTMDMIPSKGFTDQETAHMLEQRKYIFNIYSFYQAADRLFFKLSGKKEDFCTIQLSDHSLQSFKYLFNNYSPTTYNPFIGSDGKNLFCLIKESDLINHYKSNECTYSNIQQLLPSLCENGNGWILLTIEINNP